MYKLFDLNIEQVLEHWEVKHALREIIANALDEHILSGSPDIKIYKDGDCWVIRDYGRGLQYIHFTQNENVEKQESSVLIGKFGVGLKDALAVFYRKGVRVEIDSQYAHITTQMAEKDGFAVTTLHALFSDAVDSNMIGTEFRFYGVSDKDMLDAKSMFLRFDEKLTFLEATDFGSVYLRRGTPAIYINGVQVASEPKFIFSYNITNINAQIKRALNRERSNVGRTAYSDTIKKILTSCISNKVLSLIVADIDRIDRGLNHDEVTWKPVCVHAVKHLSKINPDKVIMTHSEYNSLTNSQRELIDKSNVVFVNDNVYSSVCSSVNTFDDVESEYRDSFQYQFVDISDLTVFEKSVFALTDMVFDFLDKHGCQCDVPVRISENICLDWFGYETLGCYDMSEHVIIIRRDVLKSKSGYLGVLFHEFVHYFGKHDDNTRAFENDLTDLIGQLALALFE